LIIQRAEEQSSAFSFGGEREACRRLGRRLSEWVQTFICHQAQYDPRNATYEQQL